MTDVRKNLEQAMKLIRDAIEADSSSPPPPAGETKAAPLLTTAGTWPDDVVKVWRMRKYDTRQTEWRLFNDGRMDVTAGGPTKREPSRTKPSELDSRPEDYEVVWTRPTPPPQDGVEARAREWAARFASRHRRHIEQSPGVGADTQKYAIACLLDYEADVAKELLAFSTAESAASREKLAELKRVHTATCIDAKMHHDHFEAATVELQDRIKHIESERDVARSERDTYRVKYNGARQAETSARHDLAAMREAHPEASCYGALPKLRAELAATIKAKQENDERYMLERDEARSDRDGLRARCEGLDELLRRCETYLAQRPNGLLADVAATLAAAKGGAGQ